MSVRKVRVKILLINIHLFIKIDKLLTGVSAYHRYVTRYYQYVTHYYQYVTPIFKNFTHSMDEGGVMSPP